MPAKPNVDLNPREENFCHIMARPDAVGSDAVVQVGYSEKGAKQKAYRLMKKPQVVERIRELRETVYKDIYKAVKKNNNRELITAKQTLMLLAGIADLDILDVTDVNGYFLPPTEWPEHARKSVQSLKVTRRKVPTGNPEHPWAEEETFDVKFANRTQALDKLMKYYDLLLPGSQFEKDDAEAARDTTLTPDKRRDFARRVAELLRQANMKVIKGGKK